jgi:Tol biopolymer transport system component
MTGEPRLFAISLRTARRSCALGAILSLVLGGGSHLVAQAAFRGTNGRIAFVRFESGTSEIFAMDANGDNLVDLTQTPSVLDGAPSYSSNGKWIVYSAADDKLYQTDVYKMRADGSLQTRLTKNSVDDIEPAYSPDGRKIVFARGQTPEIFVMKPDGSNIKRLTRAPGRSFSPAWSPDGSRIAFVSTRDADHDQEIFVMHADGSHEHRLTNNGLPDDHPDWSPDGARIVFGSLSMTRSNVFTMKSVDLNNDGEGDDLTNLTKSDSSDNFDPAYSPNGHKIVFSSARDGNAGIFVMDASTGDHAHALINVYSSDSQPTWQPIR